MNPSAEIFETLVQLPDRTPAQRADDERSAAILRDADALRGDEEVFTSEDVDLAIAAELRTPAEEFAPSAKRPRAILLERAEELEAS
jgi:hypothetical protein